MKKIIVFVLAWVMLFSQGAYAQNYHRISLAYIHPNLEEFNEFISGEISTSFSERGVQIGYHYLADMGIITNVKMGLGVNIDSNWAKRKGLILKTKVYLLGLSADMIIEYTKKIMGLFDFGIGISGGVSTLGYLRMKLSKKNMWRYYWDLEPYVALSVNLGFFGSLSFLAGYHFRKAFGEWTEGGKIVKNSSDVLDSVHYLRLSLGFDVDF